MHERYALYLTATWVMVCAYFVLWAENANRECRFFYHSRDGIMKFIARRLDIGEASMYRIWQHPKNVSDLVERV